LNETNKIDILFSVHGLDFAKAGGRSVSNGREGFPFISQADYRTSQGFSE